MSPSEVHSHRRLQPKEVNPWQNHGEYLLCLKHEPPLVESKVHHEEILAVESESIDTQSLDSTPRSSPDPELETLKEEEPLPLKFLHCFEEDLFEDFGNTLNYLCQKGPPVPITPFEPYEKEFLRQNNQGVDHPNERWMVMRRRVIFWATPNQPSFSHLVPHKGPKCGGSLYPAVGANIMLDNFALALLGSAALTPIGKTLRGPSGSLVGSYGVI
jgi:hypothetical protein